MIERVIACVLADKWIPRVGKYVVKLGFDGEKAEEVWMTEKQLANLEANFASTPHGHSTDRCKVIGLWNDRGYYAYSRLEKVVFIEPPQYNLNDLKD